MDRWSGPLLDTPILSHPRHLMLLCVLASASIVLAVLTLTSCTRQCQGCFGIIVAARACAEPYPIEITSALIE
ncbi:hypothetical protein MRX96_027378 [Rhipicephalus microplus]